MTESVFLGLKPTADDVRTGLFGGVGSVSVWNLLGRQRAAPFTAVLACELSPGADVGRHVQQRDAELLIGLEGTGLVTIAGVTKTFGAGVVHHVAFGTSLAIRNTSGTASLRYLIIKGTPPSTADAK
ncbi:MAG: cupin domain-containing protein [Myxococcales bacterium]|nr:cupin domain-containing protein [Myxococcales bacterium]